MAQFIDFPESNKALGKPADMTDAECGTLHVFCDGTSCISRWQPTAEELAELNNGGSLWLGVRSGMTQPPVFLTAIKPDMSYRHPFTAEIKTALDYIASILPMPEAIGLGLRSGADLADAYPVDLKGEAIESGKQYLITSEDAQAQHVLNMAKAYGEMGMAGVVEYLHPYAAFLPQEVITLPRGE